MTTFPNESLIYNMVSVKLIFFIQIVWTPCQNLEINPALHTKASFFFKIVYVALYRAMRELTFQNKRIIEKNTVVLWYYLFHPINTTISCHRNVWMPMEFTQVVKNIRWTHFLTHWGRHFLNTLTQFRIFEFPRCQHVFNEYSNVFKVSPKKYSKGVYLDPIFRMSCNGKMITC